MVDALEIGYAIKDRRAQLALTQSAVAEAAGVSSRSVWSLELGRNDGVQLNKLLAVFKVLGLDLRISVMINRATIRWLIGRPAYQGGTLLIQYEDQVCHQQCLTFARHGDNVQYRSLQQCLNHHATRHIV